MRKSLEIGVVALAGLLFVATSAQAAVTTNEKQAVVRIEVRTTTNVLKSSGAGVVIDLRGHVLTNRHVIEPKLTTDTDIISLCVSQDDGVAPSCNMHAKILDSRVDPQDIALLQITELKDGKLGWISLDEYRLRHGNPSFLKHVKLDKTVTVKDPLALGDSLQFLGYHNAATDTLMYTQGIVSGFQKVTYKNVLAPWYIKTDVDVAVVSGSGGGAFDKDANFVGIPTKTASKVGYILSRPMLNQYLKETLGSTYASSSPDALPANSSVGVFNGLLETMNCPLYSTKGAANTGCRCDVGFFAVGDSCINASTYCPIKGGTYDYDGQKCDGIPVVAPKPVTLTPAKATSTVILVTLPMTPLTPATIDQTKDAFVQAQIGKLGTSNPALVQRLRGMILLQTQSHGEAWYLDPVTLKRAYMKDGATAYQMLRTFGVGITNEDLAKLKAGDKTLVEQMKGRIVLQVQSHGEAYYIHPMNGTAYYLKDGDAAYKVMREVSLGVADADLIGIPINAFVAKK